MWWGWGGVLFVAFLVFICLGGFGLMFGKQPLSVGSSLLGSVLGVSGCVGSGCSSWLGFLVCMIYLSGIMVMFSYVCFLLQNVFFFKFLVKSLFFLLGWFLW
uniref:NADH dehydrogenase subunit 6 n=1 Tax=Trisidos kiyonoi TaxID=935009 RepID=A0A1U9ALQ5_TRIKY|nr:NADH dehydrogenase subunit 6 [Trisidos kiyonoi]